MVTNSPRFNIAPEPGLEIETENACAKAGCATKATVTTEERSSAKDKMEKERENQFKVLHTDSEFRLIIPYFHESGIREIFLICSRRYQYFRVIILRFNRRASWVMSSPLGLFVWRLEG